MAAETRIMVPEMTAIAKERPVNTFHGTGYGHSIRRAIGRVVYVCEL
jgi:hypothetical protein